MIIESIVLGITSTIISSLIFADRILKRDRDDKNKFEEEIAELESLQPNSLRPLRPFINICDGRACPTCGVDTSLHYKFGLALPTVCSKVDCKYKEFPHLHTECHTCKVNLVMKTRDGK